MQPDNRSPRWMKENAPDELAAKTGPPVIDWPTPEVLLIREHGPAAAKAILTKKCDAN